MSPSVSVTIMAHKRRSSFVSQLQEKLDRPADVAWDRQEDRWETGRRAMLSYDPSSSFHLVVQDDAVVCRDLVAGLESSLEHVPEDSPLCLYIGKAFRARVTEPPRGVCWLTMPQVHWGVGVLIPTNLIREMVKWGDQCRKVPNYDKRISRWAESRNLTVYYPWPNLVDHRESPSLVRGRGSRGRQSWRFIGENVSALSVDWTQGVAPIRLVPNRGRMDRVYGTVGYQNPQRTIEGRRAKKTRPLPEDFRS